MALGDISERRLDGSLGGLEETIKKEKISKRIFDFFIYSGKAIGKDGKKFRLYKFRTMYLDADKRVDEAFKNGVDEFGKPLNDPRITPLGKILRRTHIDELPQVYNVLKGDMCLVGYAPRTLEYWKKYLTLEHMELMTKNEKPGLGRLHYAFKENGNKELASKEISSNGKLNWVIDGERRYIGQIKDEGYITKKGMKLGYAFMIPYRMVNNIIHGRSSTA